MTSLYLITTLCIIAFAFPTIISSQLVAVPAQSKFPYPLKESAPYYDGMDSVYIFGGLDSNYNYRGEIFKYSISSDTIESVGRLPGNISSGAVVSNGLGTIYYMGGFDVNPPASYLKTIYAFNTTTNTINLWGNLPIGLSQCSAIAMNSTNVLIIGGYSTPSHFKNVTSLHLATSTFTNVYTFPPEYQITTRLVLMNNTKTILGKMHHGSSNLFKYDTGTHAVTNFEVPYYLSS